MEALHPLPVGPAHVVSISLRLAGAGFGACMPGCRWSRITARTGLWYNPYFWQLHYDQGGPVDGPKRATTRWRDEQLHYCFTQSHARTTAGEKDNIERYADTLRFWVQI